LACFQPGPQIFPRQIEGFALLADRQSETHPRVQQLAFFAAHLQKISGIADLPTRGATASWNVGAEVLSESAFDLRRSVHSTKHVAKWPITSSITTTMARGGV